MTKTKRILNIFIQGGIFALIPIIILVYKPSYTYKQAINIISSKIDIPYEIEKTDVNILLENTSNPLVKKIYYISFLTQSESRVSFTFDPCTGIYNQVEDN